MKKVGGWRHVPKASTMRRAPTTTRPAPAAGDVKREGTLPTCTDAIVVPDEGSSAIRSPVSVATVHTAAPAMIVGPGVETAAVHPTVKLSPFTVTWTTPFEQGTNIVSPSCAMPPNTRLSQTLPECSCPRNAAEVLGVEEVADPTLSDLEDAPAGKEYRTRGSEVGIAGIQGSPVPRGERIEQLQVALRRMTLLP